MLDIEIDATEYKEIKTEYEAEIEKLERKIDELTMLDSHLKEHISFAVNCLGISEIFYCSGPYGQTTNFGFNTFRKTRFSESSYRTIKFRNIVSLICRPSKDYKRGRKKKSSENSELSNLVPRTGIEPAHP